MRIAIDIDNVLTDTTTQILAFINSCFPQVNLKMEDMTSYWIEDALPPECQWIVPIAFEQKSVWKKVRMIEGAAYYIHRLYEDGAEIYFATATTAENFRKKIGFLTRELNFFPEGYVRQHAISIKKKQLLNVDFLVDDCYDHFIDLPPYHGICFEYPWNEKFKAEQYAEKNDVTFCKDWKEIYHAIQGRHMEELGLFK
jgi:5'(3')-deoxyribonucleotidase